MEDYEFLAKYANLPMPERKNVISTIYLGYAITWNDLFDEVNRQVREGKKSELFTRFNEYKLYRFMSSYTKVVPCACNCNQCVTCYHK